MLAEFHATEKQGVTSGHTAVGLKWEHVETIAPEPWRVALSALAKK